MSMAIITKPYYFGTDYEMLIGNEKGVYCDGKAHPKGGFRPYRRGWRRCATCGARKGIKIDWEAYNGTISNSNLK